MSEPGTLQILALCRMLSPAERAVYGLPVSEVEPEHVFIFLGLVRAGLADVRELDPEDGPAYVATVDGKRAVRAALERVNAAGEG